ncbi:MAG: ABC transporter permease [Deltaproteobacteria bacterium]|nr:ABC transporter permease [Deltaproteobacteria bacterium]
MKREPVLVELWRFRGLLRSLVVRDLRVKYQRSLLGLVWTLLNPLLTVAILITVFSYIIRIQIPHYWAFLISGFFAWNFIQRTLYHATAILREHASLSRSVYYPLEVLILSASLSKLAEFLIEITIVLLVLLVFHHGGVPPSLVLFPLIVLLQVVLAIGLMFPLAAVAVLYYDVQHALPIVITSLFYISPVFYPVEMIPEGARLVYHLNPVVGLLRLYHVVFYEGGWPSWTLLAGVFVTAAVTCAAGHAIFKRCKESCVEIA